MDELARGHPPGRVLGWARFRIADIDGFNAFDIPIAQRLVVVGRRARRRAPRPRAAKLDVLQAVATT